MKNAAIKVVYLEQLETCDDNQLDKISKIKPAAFRCYHQLPRLASKEFRELVCMVKMQRSRKRKAEKSDDNPQKKNKIEPEIELDDEVWEAEKLTTPILTCSHLLFE